MQKLSSIKAVILRAYNLERVNLKDYYTELHKYF